MIGFKKALFSTKSLAKLLSDSLLLDSLLLDSSISQSHSKLQFKSTNHIQSCNYVLRARALASAFFAGGLRMFTPPLSASQSQISPFLVVDMRSIETPIC